MEAPMKYICFLVFVVVLSIVGLNGIDGAGECGKNSSPDSEAWKLAPCASAARDPNSIVSDKCCQVVKQILGKTTSCLCAVMLSNTAKMAAILTGLKPDGALAIPKRCNFTDRPIGYKCGAYTLP